jgi:hypothetical protein
MRRAHPTTTPRLKDAALVVDCGDGAVARKGEHVPRRLVERHFPAAEPSFVRDPMNGCADVTALHDPWHGRSTV